MIIFPSILEKTPEELFLQIQKLSKYYSYFQIDIADGIYVPNKTVQIEDILRSGLIEAGPLSDKTFEFHLMVKDYEKGVEQLLELKKFLDIKTVLINTSLSPNIQDLKSKIHEFSFALVLNPEDSVETIKTKYDLSKIPLIQIMSVIPGAQGNSFIQESLQKIEQLRDANYRNKISLDGGINEKTIPVILSQNYLPDILCPGSFLTRADNIEERVAYLRKQQPY